LIRELSFLSELDERPTPIPTKRRALRAQRRLDAEEITELVAAYKAGRSIRDLATVFGIHRTTVGDHLSRQGVARRHNPLGPEELDLATRLYADGWSPAKIADHVGA
jgi:hypothetical protein